MDITTVNEIIQYLIPILATILTVVFSYVAVKIKSIYQEKVNTELKESVVASAVEFVEQVFQDLDGEEKFNTAVERVIAVLQEKGIAITETEVQMLVESAVYGLNQGWSTEVIDNEEGQEVENVEETADENVEG